MEFVEEFPEAVAAIVDRHYVDDYLDSSDTEEMAIMQIQNVIEIHRRGGFHICSWISSSPEVIRQLSQELVADGMKNFESELDVPIERILGLKLDPVTDRFVFNLKFHKVDIAIVSGERRPTKREVLKLIMSIFDPLGFVTHLVVKGRIILQHIWMSGIGWDDEITEEVHDKWVGWIEELQSLVSFSTPKCYMPSVSSAEIEEIQLHVFSDASAQAFSSVAYFRFKTKSDGIFVLCVMSKARVAPVKPVSIPRLELQAALLGSRMSRAIKEEHEIKISSTFFWTDPRTVLHWLKSEARRFKTFVSHRIGEIDELTDVNQWFWVPTKLNVADEATRDNKPSDLDCDSRWLSGPNFLRQPESQWPCVAEEENSNVSSNDLELKEKFVMAICKSNFSLPEISRFSSWMRLIRTTAWILRCVSNLQNKIKSIEIIVSELLPSEMKRAETLWIKKLQLENFPSEIKALSDGSFISKSSRIVKLMPFLDSDGILRVKGRLAQAGEEIMPCTRQHAILDPQNLFTKLLIKYYYEKAGHHGQEMVVNKLRQRYWILNMRQAVRSSWSSCVDCKVRRSLPQVPEMGQIPAVRVLVLTPNIRPFTFTGVDYFGPMEVTIGRRHKKRYGALFTCLTIRAVHLELVESMTTDSVIMAIRRFIGRRGRPREMWSDNGTNFRGADVEMRKAMADLDHEKIQRVLFSREIKWVFIPPSAPHMGGCWERMVTSVKTALKATLIERSPKPEILQTLFVEAENIVNSRPLTHVPADPEDDESLTPNHFLIGSSSSAQQPGIFDDKDLCLRKQWRAAQRMADVFWKKWVTSYLPTLSRRDKWFQQTRPVEVGDLVFIVDDQLPRNMWLRGLVTAIYPGKDGLIRIVDVRTSRGTYRRPVAKICILDIQKAQQEEVSQSDGDLQTAGEDVAEQKN